MANRYVVVYQDESNNLQLAPPELKVNFQDTVIWVSNLSEDYQAKNFVPTNPTVPPANRIFQQASFDMPPGSQSTPGVVIKRVDFGQPPVSYSYQCTGDSGTGDSSGAEDESVNGVIIVEPSLPQEPRQQPTKQQPVGAANGSRH